MSRSRREKFDAFTLHLEQTDQLLAHVAARLEAVAEEHRVEECDALALIASGIRDRLAALGAQAGALVGVKGQP